MNIKGEPMISKSLDSICEQLDRIEQKLDNKKRKKYLTIADVSEISSLHHSTIRRAIRSGSLKCKKRLGKILFLESDIDNWLGGN